MRLTVIGCAGSYPGPASPASCYLLETGTGEETFRVLLDAGNGSLGVLQRHLDPRSLDAVLLTHLHPDHCLDLTSLNVFLAHHPDGPRETPLPVYGPAGAPERLGRAYDPTPDGSDEEGLAAYAFQPAWVADEPVRIGPLTVVPVPAWHTVEAYGFRITARGCEVVLAYTGDTDDDPGLDRLAADADLLLAEAAFADGRDTVRGMHLTGRRAGELAARNRVRTLMLTHIPAWNDPRLTLAHAREVYDGTLLLASSGAVVDL